MNEEKALMLRLEILSSYQRIKDKPGENSRDIYLDQGASKGLTIILFLATVEWNQIWSSYDPDKRIPP